MKILAFAVSILFHPLLLPLYVLFITFHTGTVFTYVPGVHAEYVLFADVVWGDIDSSALFAIVEVVRFDRGLPSDAEAGPGVPGIGDDRGDFYRVLFLSQFAVF